MPKKKQHYIPQVYLRGFSLEYEPLGKSRTPNEKHTIYAYDLEKKAYDSTAAVPITSICYIKELYEIYGLDGNIIFPNWLENYFCILEKKFGKYRGELEKKTNKDNIGKLNFLTTKERIFWITFIAIHLLRNVYALSEAEKAIKELTNCGATDKEVKSIVRKFCLPFFQEIKEDSYEAKILERIITPMLKMQFVIGVDFNSQIITSDKGASIIAKEFLSEEYDEVIFPITSSICLFLLGNENKSVYQDNILFEINEESRRHIATNVVLDAYKKIYSNHRFSVEEKKFIKNITIGRKDANR